MNGGENTCEGGDLAAGTTLVQVEAEVVMKANGSAVDTAGICHTKSPPFVRSSLPAWLAASKVRVESTRACVHGCVLLSSFDRTTD